MGGQFIHQMLGRPPGDLAIVTANGIYTAGEILRLSEAVADCLDRDRPRGYRVMVPTSHPAKFLAGVLGCIAAGCTAIPWRNDTPAFERHQRELLRPNAWLQMDDGVAMESQGASEDRPWIGDIILTTTGSTGSPKGVALTFDQLLINASLAGAAVEINVGAQWAIDVNPGLTSGFCHILMAWLRRATLVYLKDMVPVDRAAVFSLPDVGFGGSPIQLSKLADLAEPSWAPVALMSSGDFLTAPIVTKLRRSFPRTRIHKFYGLTEVAGRFCTLPSDLIDGHPDAAGYPLPGFSARIYDEHGRVVAAGGEGEIWLRSPLLMRGYVHHNDRFEATSPDSWFRTGDCGFASENGLIAVTGRVDDSFKVGGEKVDRATIELALRDALANHAYCVLPFPHDALGYCAALFVEVPKDGAMPSWSNLVRQVASSLPSRYVPMFGFGVKAIPRQENGKIDRAALLELAKNAERLV